MGRLTAKTMVASGHDFISDAFDADKALIVDGLLRLCIRLIVEECEYAQKDRSDAAEKAHAAGSADADEHQCQQSCH